MNQPLGIHYIFEFYACKLEEINDLTQLKHHLFAAAKAANAEVVADYFHEFSPFGITGTLVITESHINIHTWPEHAFVTLDIFSCGQNVKPELAKKYLNEAFAPERIVTKVLPRGDEILASNY